ncbi:MAG: hypothetical protein J6S19_07235, partial [Lentisphaeria bacterium]|nr:hypothetical protein [Lentisphaeria bacterium]
MAETLLYAPAPAKINLFLKDTARRSDGYHELESLFLPLAVPADDIAIDLEALPGAVTVGTSDIMLPGGTNNIAGKAAESWAKKSAVMPHWDINIVKNIPVAAGLGGGSSDAAAVLKLLNDHAGKALDDEALHSAALELGADVPFFLDPVPSVMTGIGEKSAPLDFALPGLHILLLAPGFPVSAAEGYRLLESDSSAPMSETLREKIIDSLRHGDVETFAGLLFNDLQKGVCNKYPILELLLSEMKSTGA